MNRQHTRFRATTLPATVGIGLLTLSLAACGGSGGEGEESSAPASSGTASEASVSATPSATEDATAGASASTSPNASSSEDAAAAGDVEAALKAVLGEGTQIVTGAQLEELQQSSQGLAEGITVTPAECGPEGQDAATGELPEGTELTGGVVVETTETGGANSDMLSVSVYPDAAAATEGMAAFEEFAAACPSYSLEMGEGLNAEATMTVEDIEAEGDAALAITIGTTVDIEGASLPAGTGDSTSTTVYVQDGERLISYAGTAAGGEPKTAAEGVELIDALRAELGG
ncbi:hypothetical protein [Citricoccus sp.]|uniref:hypothetical protein n=1 Tax=Citricoccus sp. TaxID=1978372 RepID=UPI0028BD32FC|nr:hypothetical protein [Citricoccus sp.]